MWEKELRDRVSGSSPHMGASIIRAAFEGQSMLQLQQGSRGNNVENYAGRYVEQSARPRVSAWGLNHDNFNAF